MSLLSDMSALKGAFLGIAAIHSIFTYKGEPKIIMKRGIHFEVRKALSHQSSCLKDSDRGLLTRRHARTSMRTTRAALFAAFLFFLLHLLVFGVLLRS